MLALSKILELTETNPTPMYLFDLDELSKRMNHIQSILGEDIRLCYAMKANPFLVDAMKKLNVKFEVCSPGEFSICEREHVDGAQIVLSGVNKEESDINHVMDDFGGVGIYTVESVSQFKMLASCAAERKMVISLLLRVTSGNQFGLDESDLEEIIRDRDQYPFVTIRGIQCYAGTQKKKFSQIEQEIVWLDSLCERYKEKYGFETMELEYGPGLPIPYFGAEAHNPGFPMLAELAEKLDTIRGKYQITLEMGRYMAATCGTFISSVADYKTNQGQNYCIIDGGINHINYYGQTMAMKIPAYDFVKADTKCCIAGIHAEQCESSVQESGEELTQWTICGSLCTVGDVIVKNLPIGDPKVGDLLILYNIGAYSVTEGIYLFLSRKMPRILAYSEQNGIEEYRDFQYSDIINSRQSVIL